MNEHIKRGGGSPVLAIAYNWGRDLFEGNKNRQGRFEWIDNVRNTGGTGGNRMKNSRRSAAKTNPNDQSQQGYIRNTELGWNWKAWSFFLTYMYIHILILEWEKPENYRNKYHFCTIIVRPGAILYLMIFGWYEPWWYRIALNHLKLWNRLENGFKRLDPNLVNYLKIISILPLYKKQLFLWYTCMYSWIRDFSEIIVHTNISKHQSTC